MTDRLSIDRTNRARLLYAGPYKSEARAEESLSQSFADGDVSLGDRPDTVKRTGFWWVEDDG